MFRTKRKAQESHNKLRRLLSEQLENRQLMAADMMQWTAIPAHLVAIPSSGAGASSAILSTQFGRTTMVSNAGSSMNFGQPILVGRVDLSQLTPTTGFANRGPVSPLNNGPVVEGRTEVGKLDPSNLPKDGSFGKTTEVSIGDAELIEFGEAILVGEVELSDVMPVIELLTGNGDSASPLSSGPAVEGRIEVDKLDPNNLPTDGSFGKTTEVELGDAELIEFGEAILVGEVDRAIVTAVIELLTGNGDSASPSSGPVVVGRTEVDKLDANNLPKDGSFGKTSEVAASKVQKKSVVSTTPWNGESVQRKRTSGSLRNQLFDSALSELFQL